MHEYSVAAELINALLPQASSVDGKIVAVILKKGELRILSDTALINAFEMLADETPLKGARLVIEIVSATVACTSCGFEGAADHVSDEAFHFAVPVLSCPSCGAEVDLRTGRELYVDRLTVQVPEETASP